MPRSRKTPLVAKDAPAPAPPMLKTLTVSGFKSHRDPHPVEFRGLTILAGANSSGKSSLMQALLLLKQTVDETYDPGPLKLDGPNVYFTSCDQFLWHAPGDSQARHMKIEATLSTGNVTFSFVPQPPGVKLEEVAYNTGGAVTRLREGMSEEEIFSQPEFSNLRPHKLGPGGRLEALRVGCFMGIRISYRKLASNVPLPGAGHELWSFLRHMFHLPGHRGNPERKYPVAAVGPEMRGLFHDYAASLIASWVKDKDDRLEALNTAMWHLGLTWKVTAEMTDAASVEVRVGRTPGGDLPASPGQRGWAHDLVSIADVGFGLSELLPVVVALVAAEPGTLVFLEQPEIHLHPKAQVKLADLIAATVNRGAQVVVETHSDLLLVAFQKAIASGHLAAEKVKAHWFKRDERGATEITPRDPDPAGAFVDWPVDFADVSSKLDLEYADAAYKRLVPLKR